MKLEQFNQCLANFYGTENYYSLRPLSNLAMTDGARFIHDLTSLIQDVAIRVSHDSKLNREEFLAVNVKVNSDGNSSFQITDGNDHVLYNSNECYYSLPANAQFSLFITNGVIMLSGEY